jgi:hypothetical protein
MEKLDNTTKYTELRKTHPFIAYESHAISINSNSIEVCYHFNLSDKFSFHPTLSIPLRKFYLAENLSVEKLDSFIFNIGMVEIISYWKAACSPQIIIKPYRLSEDQILWWKKLYFYGLGEFFFLNSLSPDIINFVEIICESDNLITKQNFKFDDSYIVPIGGGKDSIVTIELLKGASKSITPLILNPRGASLKTVNKAGFSDEETIIINRKIDAGLLDLNEKGFLNGHTPFSALLAFITAMMAVVSGKKNIALSNEASANESTIAGQKINHQYSKSYEFEEDFRYYISNYVSDEINYFSFLRPLQEIQIAKIFSGFPIYFDIFKSCNVGSKNDIWCCTCPKCLFVYIILSPFLNEDELLTIFGKNLYNEKDLIFYFTQLTGEAEIKPFECIGTVEEVNIALCKVIDNCEGKELPYLLSYYKESQFYVRYKDESFEKHINTIEQNHFIDNNLLKLIESKLYDRKLS